MAATLRQWIHATDPGLARARTALRSMLALLIGGGCSAAVLTQMGESARTGIVGGMIGMMAVMMVQGPTDRARLLILGRLALVAIVSATMAAVLAGWPIASYAGFLVVIAGAAWVQRWGPSYIGVGVIAFMAHFNVLFQKIGIAQIPGLLLSLVIGFISVALVVFVLVRDRPATRVRRIVPGFRARILRLVDVVREVAEKRSFERGGRLLLEATGALQETALQIETMLENPQARAGVADPVRLRDHTFLVEVLADHLAAMAVVALREHDTTGLDELSRQLRFVPPPETLSSGDPPTTAELLPPHPAPARDRAADLARRLARALGSVESAAYAPGNAASKAATAWPADADDVDEEPAAGQEPASPPEPAGERLHLSPTTRRMIQVTLASALSIVLGMWFSETYWYYAVIGASFTLLTTPTRGASIRRAMERIVGTAIGVVGGVGLAALLSGQSSIELAFIVALLFFAFWFFQASNLMVVILFTTIIALVYDLMAVHALELLLVRLVETLIGASFGALAAFLVLPLSTRRALDEQVVRSLAALDGVLESLDPRGRPAAGHAAVHNRLRQLDQAFSAFRLTGRPLATGLPIRTAREAERELLLMSSLRYRARDLVTAATGADSVIGHLEPAALPALDLVRRRAEWIRRKIDRPDDIPGSAAPVDPGDDEALSAASGKVGETLRALYERLQSFAESRALARQVERRAFVEQV